MANSLYRKKIDEAVMNLVIRFKEAKDFVYVLNVELLRELSKPKTARQEFLRDLFSVLLESAISTFDLNRYGGLDEFIVQEFYKQALVHNKDSVLNLSQQLLDKASKAKKDKALRVLWPLIKELLSLVDTGSLEVPTCLQLLVEVYITKAAGEEPSKPEDWARPAEVFSWCYPQCEVCPELNLFLEDPKAEEKTIALTADRQEHVKRTFTYLKTGNGGREGETRFTKTLEEWKERHHSWQWSVKAVQEKLRRELPKHALEQVLGAKYNELMGSTTQAPDETQPPSRPSRPSRPKRMKGEDTNGAGAGRSSKRARGGEKDKGRDK